MKKNIPDIRWTTINKRLNNILDPNLNLKIQQKYMHKRTLHSNDTKGWGTRNFEIQFITVLLNNDNIWWFPKNSKNRVYTGSWGDNYIFDISLWVPENVKSQIIRYLDISKEELLSYDYSYDFSGITEILRVSDKRIGYKRLLEKVDNYIPAAQLIFKERFKNKIKEKL